MHPGAKGRSRGGDTVHAGEDRTGDRGRIWGEPAGCHKWRRHFLAREGDMAMPGTDEERKALEEKNAELVRELQRARRELEETEKGCIGYGWNAMCWKRWRKC